MSKLDSYLEYITPRRSKWTVKEYKCTLERYFAFIKNSEITRENALSFLNQLSCEGCGSRSLNRHLAALRSFFKFLDKKLEIEPYSAITKLPAWLNEEEQALYLSAVKTLYEKALVTCFLKSGMRLEELCRLERKGVEKGGFLHVLGKRGKERRIDVEDEVIDIINQWLDTRKDSDSRVFPQHRSTIEQGIKEIGLRVRLKVTPHLLRHTACSNDIAEGAPIADVRDKFGHANISTTNIYVHSRPEERRKRLLERKKRLAAGV